MGTRTGHLRLNLFIRAFGHHPAAWRHPDTARSTKPDLAYWIRLARAAEAAKLDAVFVADFAGQGAEALTRPAIPAPGYQFEPLTLMAAIAGATRRIGLIATASTNLNTPFHVARGFASLDHISGGRAGWNIVTSLAPSAVEAIDPTLTLDHGARYRRAAEFVEICRGFWDGWTDEAFDTLDKEASSALDRAKARPVDHRGDHFHVTGLLDTARPVQGHPVLVQAGNSEEGRDFTARFAEMVYCTAQSLDVAKIYYDDVKGRMAAFGRKTAELLVMPGLMPIVGESEQEAQDKLGALQDLFEPGDLASGLGLDLLKYPLDAPLPEHMPDVENGRGRYAQMISFAREHRLTVRELIAQFTVFRGHFAAVGTAQSIADMMEGWFQAFATDGFNLIPPLLPFGFNDFAQQVLPELRRRSLIRHRYSGSTLRHHLGLHHPKN